MPRTFVLVFTFLLTLPVHARDLSKGFKNYYQISDSAEIAITEADIESLITQLNELAGREVYNYKPGTRRISDDGLRLECKTKNENCRKDITLYTAKAGVSDVAKAGDIANSEDLGNPKKAPWRKYRVNVPEDARKLSLEMQKYVYEGWIKNSVKEDSATHFKQNDERTWCMVPWMNQLQGNLSSQRKGRDLMHGLTKEFPIDNSAAFDDIPFKDMKDKDGRTVKDPDSFSSYGVAYFNRPNCEHLINIFGDEKEPKDPKVWLDQRVAAIGNSEQVRTQYETQDGSVSFKMLFTTLQAEETGEKTHGLYPILQGAYKWVAHVSTERGGNSELPRRFMQKVSHAQMDIAIKDSGLKGLADPSIPWVMLTYYFDPNYINPIFDRTSEIRLSDEEIAKAPEGLKHMRPIGIQYGLGMGESIILYEPGNGVLGTPLGIARNNHQPPGPHTWSLAEQKDFFANGADYFTDTRLNGPADNPRSSCLGCHASAGVNRFKRYYEVAGSSPKAYQFDVVPLTPRVNRSSGEHNHPVEGEIHEDLGVLDNQTHKDLVQGTLNVDFNQQIRISLERYLRTK